MQGIKHGFKTFSFLTHVALVSNLKLAKITINFALDKTTAEFARQRNTA
jgi:hypothetical protein